MSLRIVFAGTPELAVPTLRALLNSEHSVVAVYTQPDRPAGRGHKLQASPVKQLAMAHHIPVYQPETLKQPDTLQQLQAFRADLMLVLAYGLLLPQAVLDSFPLGCINPHVSLLPRWRGSAPIQRAIEAGDASTGVTLMQMDKGWDTGPILAKVATPISATDTSASVHARLGELAAELVIQQLPRLEAKQIIPEPQSDQFACYAKKLTKEEAKIDWSLSAEVLARKVRAFDLWPVTFCEWEGEPLRVWRAQALQVDGKLANVSAGTLVAASAEGLDVLTGQGILRLLEVQQAGGKRLAVRDFYNARRELLAPGVTRFF